MPADALFFQGEAEGSPKKSNAEYRCSLEYQGSDFPSHCLGYGSELLHELVELVRLQ
jgi:hypothetical protein